MPHERTRARIIDRSPDVKAVRYRSATPEAVSSVHQAYAVKRSRSFPRFSTVFEFFARFGTRSIRFRRLRAGGFQSCSEPRMHPLVHSDRWGPATVYPPRILWRTATTIIFIDPIHSYMDETLNISRCWEMRSRSLLFRYTRGFTCREYSSYSYTQLHTMAICFPGRFAPLPFSQRYNVIRVMNYSSF